MEPDLDSATHCEHNDGAEKEIRRGRDCHPDVTFPLPPEGHRRPVELVVRSWSIQEPPIARLRNLPDSPHTQVPQEGHISGREKSLAERESEAAGSVALDDPRIEITPEMIEAGCVELSLFESGD